MKPLSKEGKDWFDGNIAADFVRTEKRRHTIAHFNELQELIGAIYENHEKVVADGKARLLTKDEPIGRNLHRTI
jgi:hypothetical protein